MRIRREKDFVSYFDEKTGRYIRSSIIKNGRLTGKEPFMASFPELLDVGIMGHCKHGLSGLCLQSGVQCYQNGLESNKPNMSLEDFTRIVEECKDNTYQIALGGCGDPDQHEDFEEILKVCWEANIVPNFTTSGLGMTEEKAKVCKEYCGAVAVSWYRNVYTQKAISMLLEAGVKTNVHFVLMKDSLQEAIELLKEDGFPSGINAVVFLLHKPVGLGEHEQVIKYSPVWEAFLKIIKEKDFSFKIGFDSCTVPALIGKRLGDVYTDTCEGSRWSAYIGADMKMMPCSFDNQEQRWAVDLHECTVQEAWNSEKFEDFRKRLRNACPDCKKRALCMGGCPIVPEIVLCQEKGKRYKSVPFI